MLKFVWRSMQVLLQGGNRMPLMLDLRKPMRVGLLPRGEPSAAAMRWFDLPPCMIFHTGNAWEEADGTVRLWVCVADQVSSHCAGIGQML